MPFQLDKSGAVDATAANGTPWKSGRWTWGKLSPFAQGYIEALFASTYDVLPGLMATADQPRDGYLKTVAVGFRDLAPETLARIIADCEIGSKEYPPALAPQGAEFWWHRQKALVYWASPQTVQLGDDGKVRFGEAG